MKFEVRVPTLSDSVASGTLLPWRKAVGDTVARDETLVDLETDKVILEIPAPASGTLVEVRAVGGAEVRADEVIALIETGEAAAAGARENATPAAPAPAPPAATAPARAAAPAESPSVAAPPPRVATATAPQPRVAPPPARAAAQPGESRREPMSRLRQRVAERLVAAQHTAAMLTTFNEVNMQPVNELRQRFKADFEVRHGVKLGYMSFFVRAVCRALEAFPIVNARIDGNDIVWHGDADIGIAISSPRGLVVPILRRAQQLSSDEIERAIADFARRARDSKLALEELAGGTFSITNGGVFGSLLSTPILNPPQSAILGMHTIQERPVAEHGQVVIRPMMYLALTYDHRLIDGRDAVQFLVAVKAALEAPDAPLPEYRA
ncbi:dihydrolipoamide succinyltransferase [Thiobacillus denitrificans ATCC 25259]|uniref:Dihydrolipoyllysine-residue succinyltransferase n=1 Tax=Thiobacillus denitrificans (strain ATCC 25259 / T1) TaxID=292415 RepID=Q3SEX1_THIDA|nr:dihydrolipoyllysine-residue succinyltransferase [Thiobacillus denitrificans]AAZ97142.1 dihydrolipoamide succinyltransferase [Thiobacillus denitrificans ATCC 25259]